MAKPAVKMKSGGGQLIEGATRKSFFMVAIDDVLAYPDWHPRFDERRAYLPDPAMVANVKLRGIQKPVRAEVRKSAGELLGKDGKQHTLPAGIYLVDGHQRWAWAREARAQLRQEGEPGADVEIPVWPISGDDSYLGSLSIALNRHVEDDPMVTARKLRSVYDRCGGDLDRTAVETGHTAGFVKQHIALPHLAPEIQKAVAARQISIGSAFDLSKLDHATQLQRFADAAEHVGESDGRRKTAVTRRALRQAGGAKSSKPTRKAIRTRLAELEGSARAADAMRAAELRWVLTGDCIEIE